MTMKRGWKYPEGRTSFKWGLCV